MRIYLQKSAETNETPRFCHIVLQEDLISGWTVTRESGIQGTAGRVARQYFASLELAQEAVTRMRDQQVKQGYRVVFTEGAYQ